MSAIVLICTCVVIHTAWRLHHQGWWQPTIKQKDFDRIEKKLNLLLYGQVHIAVAAAIGLLMVIWTTGPLLLLSGLTLVLLMAFIILWWVRTRAWHAAKMVKDVPYSDTQIG
jgi:hypothetical protein